MTALRSDNDIADVEELQRRVAGVARAMGRDDLAAALHGRSPDGRGVQVLVAGETQRGKSRLVNVLVGRPNLLPVGEASTTGCYIEVRWGDIEAAIVSHALLQADGQVTTRRSVIDVDRIADHARIGDAHGVAGIEVELPSPLLEGLVVIDTPGLGSTEMARNRVTLAALDAADALLFVCDASQPILGPELRLLEHAARRVTAIAVIVTKTDRFPAHAEVVAETRARIAERAALRDVVVLPVSASTAERAAVMERTDLARAQLLRRISGLEVLTAYLAATRELVFRSFLAPRWSVGRGDTPVTSGSWILGREEDSIDRSFTVLVRVIRRCLPAPPHRARWPVCWPCSARALPPRHSRPSSGWLSA